MTKAAKAFKKDLSHFWRAADTADYLLAAAAQCSAKSADLFMAQGGWHLNPEVGTWAHPKLAVFFARWLDVRFAVWCDSVIDDILRGRVVPQQAAPEPQCRTMGVQLLIDGVDIREMLKAVHSLEFQ